MIFLTLAPHGEDSFHRKSFQILDEYTASHDLDHFHGEYPGGDPADFIKVKWSTILHHLECGKDIFYISSNLVFVGHELGLDQFPDSRHQILLGRQNYSAWGIDIGSSITSSFCYLKSFPRMIELIKAFLFQIEGVEWDSAFHSYGEQNADFILQNLLKSQLGDSLCDTINNDEFCVSEEILGKNLDFYKANPDKLSFINMERNVYTDEIKNCYFKYLLNKNLPR